MLPVSKRAGGVARLLPSFGRQQPREQRKREKARGGEKGRLYGLLPWLNERMRKRGGNREMERMLRESGEEDEKRE